MNSIAARLDELPKGAWIALMVVAFIVFWPIGLGILAYLIWSGRMGCSWRQDRREWRERRERMHEAAHRWWHGNGRGAHGAAPSSGNRAFDEYREDTLRRLEDEQKEFRDFLDRLRHAKDKAEFDQFMDDRRRRRDAPPPAEPPPVPPEPAR